MTCEYFLLIRRQRRPCLLAIDDGLSLAGQHAGRDSGKMQDYIINLLSLYRPVVHYQSTHSAPVSFIELMPIAGFVGKIAALPALIIFTAADAYAPRKPIVPYAFDTKTRCRTAKRYVPHQQHGDTHTVQPPVE